MAIGPPSEKPITMARSEPTASMTALASSIRTSRDGSRSSGTRSESPVRACRRASTVRTLPAGRGIARASVLSTSARCGWSRASLGRYRPDRRPLSGTRCEPLRPGRVGPRLQEFEAQHLRRDRDGVIGGKPSPHRLVDDVVRLAACSAMAWPARSRMSRRTREDAPQHAWFRSVIGVTRPDSALTVARRYVRARRGGFPILL